jgi:thermostable 8-oxoguanine DNA glycosylase
MGPNKIWLELVDQVCVMGAAEPMARLRADIERYKAFEDAVKWTIIISQQNPVTYLSNILQEFSATRFHTRSAEKLVSLLQSPRVFQDGKLLLLEELSHHNDGLHTRDELIQRCPIFKLKSASDFMISVGLSHDVIALDKRIVGIFQKYFDYNLNSNQIQANRNYYLSLETTLREFCQKKHISLAFLDRLLFNFTNVSAIELVLKYPKFTDRIT